MNSFASSIADFLRVIFFLGATLTFGEILRQEVTRKLSQPKSSLEGHSEKLTGAKLDLSYERVYGSAYAD